MLPTPRPLRPIHPSPPSPVASDPPLQRIWQRLDPQLQLQMAQCLADLLRRMSAPKVATGKEQGDEHAAFDQDLQ